jgi:hypothetical protein
VTERRFRYVDLNWLINNGRSRLQNFGVSVARHFLVMERSYAGLRIPTLKVALLADEVYNELEDEERFTGAIYTPLH